LENIPLFTITTNIGQKYLETLLENNSNIIHISTGFRNPKVIVKSKLDEVLKKHSTIKWIKWELDIVPNTSTLVPSKSIADDLLHREKNFYCTEFSNEK
jgi:hypothetical protein